jgi:hypothetical protein
MQQDVVGRFYAPLFKFPVKIESEALAEFFREENQSLLEKI